MKFQVNIDHECWEILIQITFLNVEIFTAVQLLAKLNSRAVLILGSLLDELILPSKGINKKKLVSKSVKLVLTYYCYNLS
jgi:hypothetical protein